MRAFKAGFAALALGAALAVTGCSQQGSGARAALDVDAKSVEGFVTKLAGETFKGKATTQADLAAVQAALPKEVSLTWGNITFDAAANATVLSDVKLTPKDMPQVGLGIQELRLFDFDAEFAKARLTGQRLTETASLASRIDAKGVSMFGMAAMMNQMAGVSTPAPVPGVPVDPTDALGPTEPAFDMGDSDYTPVFEKYDFTFSRVILNDIVLRPIEAVPAPAANAAATPDAYGMTPEAEAMFRGYINVMRAFGVDTFAAYDMKADFAMKQMGQTIGASFVAKTMGTRGWRGGDFDASYARDMAYSFNMTEGPMAPAMNASYAIGYVGMEDLHFDKLYGYMAQGVVPPRTETKLMSFGKYTFENQKLNIGGKDIMTIGESDLDMRDFHWFIPTKITTSAKNATFDIASMVEMAEAASASMAAVPQDPDYPAPPAPDFAAIRAALTKNGFDKPNLNWNFGYTWNETSGDTKVDLGFGGDKLLQITNKYEGTFPSFKAVSDLIPDDVTQTNEAAIAKIFDDSSKLKLVDINIVDNGGLEKMFNLTADLGPVMAASDPTGFNPMEGQTGASLRQMAGSMLGMFGATPDIAPFVTPISTFVMQGGKLHIALKPATPMTWTAIGNSLSGTTGTSPGEELKKLGLKVEHSK